VRYPPNGNGVPDGVGTGGSVGPPLELGDGDAEELSVGDGEADGDDAAEPLADAVVVDVALGAGELEADVCAALSWGRWSTPRELGSMPAYLAATVRTRRT
jgi:hypothetical protein